ncbi:MAG: hypothetical protein ACPL28_05975 [bacterium]
MPDIAFGAGYYLTVWSDARNGYGYYEIYGARVTPSGTVMEPNGLLIGYGTTPYYYYPAVVFNGTNFLVAWVNGAPPYRTNGRFVNPDGSFGSDTLTLANASNYTYRCRLAYSGTNYLVTWTEYSSITSTYSVMGQIISNSGTPIGSPFTIADSTDYYSLSVRFAGSNYYLVAFSKRIGSVYQICGRFVNTSGQPVGSVFNISNSSYSSCYNDLFLGTGNKFLNVWCEYRNNNYDIYGNLDVVIGIEESGLPKKFESVLKSTIVTKAIELKDREISGTIYNIAGEYIGDLVKGYFDCSRLNAGVYIIKTDNGDKYRVIKIR